MKLKARYILPTFYLATAFVAFIGQSESLFMIGYLLSMPILLIIWGLVDFFYIKPVTLNGLIGDGLYFAILITTFFYFGIGYLWDISVEKFTARPRSYRPFIDNTSTCDLPRRYVLKNFPPNLSRPSNQRPTQHFVRFMRLKITFIFPTQRA